MSAHLYNRHIPTKERNKMNQEQRLVKQEQIDALADKYLDRALAQGDAFTEGLCNWAINQALQEIGGL